jgi:lysophospholipase L1-like esterase
MDVVQKKPDAVLIMGGSNDLWWDLEINSILANLFAMACQAQYYEIAPVIGLPLPLYLENVKKTEMMEPLGGFEKCVNQLNRLVSEITNAAEKSEIPCLDYYHLFLDQQGRVQGQYFLEDGLHANKEGHRLMAEEAAEQFRTLFFLK